jgi:DNA-binding transcriptional LysR family regulator
MSGEGTRPPKRQGSLPSLSSLRAFEATFRLGGVRKAAEALGMHHAAVGRQLKNLEAWAGLPLFVRARGKIGLTREGSRYHQKVSAAFGEIELASQELRGLEQGGPLRVSCAAGLAIEWLAVEMSDFEREHPEFAIQIRPSDEPADLRSYEADVNLHFYPDGAPELRSGPGLKAVDLVRPRVLVFASPALAATLPPIQSPLDLVDRVLLHGATDDIWRSWLTFHGAEASDALPGIQCWHPNMAIAEARRGRGVLLASRFLVKAELERGDLVELEVPGVPHTAAGAYAFVARADRWTQPNVAALRRFVQRRMIMFETEG